MTVRIAFLSSGSGSLFSRLLDRFAGDPRIAFCGVIADSASSPLLSIGGDRTPIEVLCRESYGSRQDYSNALVGQLHLWEPDWVMMAFDHVLEGAILERFRDRLLNVHYGLLPAFRGRDPIPRALNSGARFVGATIHLAVAEADSGAPVIQAVVPANPDALPEEVQNDLFQLMMTMGLQVLEWIASGRLIIASDEVYIEDAEFSSYPINPRPVDFQDEILWEESTS